jgi:hypothetical protein
MNERLKEIAVKAQVEHCISHVRLQEFAELIVRECIHVAYNKMAIQKLDGIRPSVVCDAIKEHFGVEL